ncbi:MAG: sulfatase-like hydrolase/transferase [Chloroflexi bacterium]|nr:sulfatase-like hydrolase/transferase [Chloroflexota bacterium]
MVYPSLAELFKATGYHTGLVGKWHCGRSWQAASGFDYWCSAERDQYPHRGEIRLVEQGRPIVHQGYRAPFLTSKALQFVRDRDEEDPFFLFVGYVDTHSPFSDHPERLVDRYRGCTFADIPRERPSPGGWVRFKPPEDEDEHREQLAQYYAAVTFIDEQVGAILDELEGRGELSNTLVVYTSDHGHMNGHHGLATKGNATVPQNFYEESILVPSIFHWPDGLPAGAVSSAVVDHCDLFQTLLNAGGVVLEAGVRLERNYPGASFLSILGGSAEPGWRTTQYCEYGNARMIRTSRFKLIRRYPPHAGEYPDELYDLVSDPRETENLVQNGVYATIFADLDTRLDDHFSRYERPQRSGRIILDQPVCNAWEPWRITPPERAV